MDSHAFFGIRLTSSSQGLALAAISQFVISCNASIFVPLLVDISRDLNSSVAVVAQLSSITTLMWALLAPVMGSLSDRLGRKPVIVVGLLIVGLTGIGCALTADYPMLFAWRFLMGIGAAAAAPVVTATVGDLYPLRGRARAMGIMFAGVILGLVIGVPALAAEAQLFGWRASFLTLGSVAIIFAIAFAWLFPAIRPHGQTALSASFVTIAKSASVRSLLSANMLRQACYQLTLTYLPSFIILTYGLSLTEIAPIVSILALGGLAGNLIGGPLADRGWQLRLVCLCPIVVGLLALSVFMSSPAIVATAAVGTLAIFFWGLTHPAYTTLAAELTVEARGTMMGINSTAIQLGDTVGPALGGLVLAFSGYPLIGVTAAALGIAASLIAQCFLRPRLYGMLERQNAS